MFKQVCCCAIVLGICSLPALVSATEPVPRPIHYQPPAQASDEWLQAATLRGGCVPGGFQMKLLAPPHIGQTVAEQPVLYWWLSQPIKADFLFNLSLSFDSTMPMEAAEPLLEVKRALDLPAGIQALALAEYGAHLQTGRDYQWSVTLLCNEQDPSANPMAMAKLRRVPDPLAAEMKRAVPSDRAYFYAEHSLWYDALQVLSEQATRVADPRPWRTLRADLLRQGGLAEVAERE